MLKKTYPYYLANEPQSPNANLVVLDKYTGKVAARVAVPDATATEKAIAEITVDDVARPTAPEVGPLARLSKSADRDTSSATRIAALLAIAALVRKNFRTDRPPRKNLRRGRAATSARPR